MGNLKNSFLIMQWNILLVTMTTSTRSYVPSSDTYIEKDSSINDEIDKLSFCYKFIIRKK